ncbi:hypothetical protein HID58_055618 [Brassica napus]|uniref:Uncharacterized protein n=1 Tax=Brassica napus TaxID=3708 RepID=A0ABQ8AKU8_BRANA|nr:hypothetical protein HID58_055618 [Brassica napus]
MPPFLTPTRPVEPQGGGGGRRFFGVVISFETFCCEFLPNCFASEHLLEGKHGGPEGPPQTGGCTHEDLKLWFAEQLKKLSTEFKHQLCEMEKNICRRFWVPEATINKCRKRKANEDNHGPSKFQFSGGKRTRSLIRRKKHSYALRSGDGNDTSEVVHPSDHELRDTPALFEREKCFENEYHNTRSLPFDENIADEVKSVTLVLLLGYAYTQRCCGLSATRKIRH